MQNIQAGRIDFQGLKYVENDSDEIPRHLLQAGDLLFNRTNSPELVGKSAVFPGGLRAIFASYLIRVRIQPELAVPQFVCHWINSPWGRIWARQVKSDGVSQSNINSTKLAEMPLPLPPIEEQVAICAKLGQLLSLANSICERALRGLQQADWLVQSCYVQAFEGTLVETEAFIAARDGRSFESATQLLERISSPGGRRPARQHAPYELAPISITRPPVMKSLADINRDSHLGTILRMSKKAMTPEQLLRASDLNVDDFYTQLKHEINAKTLKETRRDTKTVLLEAMP